MATAPHVRSKAQQSETDSWLVFRNGTHMHGNMELVRQVEVPRYSQQTVEGVELSHDKRLALAVARAVESDKSFVEDYYNPFEQIEADLSDVEGEEFAVMTELGQDEFEWVEYERNPAFDAVWDPEDE